MYTWLNYHHFSSVYTNCMHYDEEINEKIPVNATCDGIGIVRLLNICIISFLWAQGHTSTRVSTKAHTRLSSSRCYKIPHLLGSLLLVSVDRRLFGVVGNLGLDIAPLGTDSEAGRDLGLPGGSSHVGNAVGVFKHGLGLFQGLSGSLGEDEQDVEESNGVEDGEDEVRLPLDVGKGHRGKETQSGVEGPVSRGGHGDTLASETEREQLRGVGPGDGTPGGRKGSHKEIGAGDETLGRGTGDTHRLGSNVVDTAGNDFTVGGENTGVGVHPQSHKHGTNEKRGTATPFVDPEQGRNGHEDVDDVLDGRGEQVGVAAVTSHGEDVGNVVHCGGNELVQWHSTEAF